MSPSISLNKLDVAYLGKCADLGLTYGIIICQNVEPENFLVVHLAKNCEEDVEILHKTNGIEPFQEISSLEDISTQALATQWISACKMCPGSFNVQDKQIGFLPQIITTFQGLSQTPVYC